MASVDIKKLFNTIAGNYDFLNHALSFRSDMRWRRKTVAAVSAGKDAPLKALDLCAGTLDLSLALLKAYPRATCAAVDFSAAMLKRGQSKIPAHLQSRLRVILADALALPFPDGRFDVVLCGWGFRNFTDYERGVREIGRVLKPGGQLLILDFFRPEGFLPRLFYQSYARYIIPAVGRLVSRDRIAYRHLHTSIGQFYSAHEFKQFIEKHDFKDSVIRHYLMQISSTVSGVRNGGSLP